ncbi:hypothetical protein K438DRAFT_1774182 [Mycena galopus ATCC 62051]|nr:hypothetical protein K438DRAFT_1774182 [Mycena galopus ATCC 62051]
MERRIGFKERGNWYFKSGRSGREVVSECENDNKHRRYQLEAISGDLCPQRWVGRHVSVQEGMQRATNMIYQEQALEWRYEDTQWRQQEGMVGAADRRKRIGHTKAHTKSEIKQVPSSSWIDIGGSDDGRTISANLGDIRVLRRELWGARECEWGGEGLQGMRYTRCLPLECVVGGRSWEWKKPTWLCHGTS